MAKRQILAVLDDLLFMVKISDAAKRAGLELQLGKTEQDTIERAQDKPLLIIVDLNCTSLNPIRLIESLKAERVPLLGFVSHVQAELKQRALEAGCDRVFARSAFSQNLPDILKSYSATELSE